MARTAWEKKKTRAATIPGPTEVDGPHSATVAPLSERIDALNSLDSWKRTTLRHKVGRLTSSRQWCRFRAISNYGQTGGFLPALGVDSQSLPGCNAAGRFQRPSERALFSNKGGFSFSEAPFEGTFTKT